MKNYNSDCLTFLGKYIPSWRFSNPISKEQGYTKAATHHFIPRAILQLPKRVCLEYKIFTDEVEVRRGECEKRGEEGKRERKG